MALNKPYLDIPGTVIFDSDMARQGYWVNQFCMSLMRAENRKRFLQDEATYLDDWPMKAEQRKGVLERDYNTLLSLGGNVYYLAKLFSTDGQSFQYAAALMTGMTEEDYREMMIKGGRSPEGNMYKKEQ